MKINEILSQTKHRPSGLPDNNWQFYQEWNRVVFLHWKVDIDELQKYIPPFLEIDLFENQAWISMVAFTMENIRPRNLPSLSCISNFNEINIRTYVKYKEKQGVYFLSIEAGKRLSTFISQKFSKMPYRFSKMRRNNMEYKSKNNMKKERLFIDYHVINGIKKKEELDVWLIERYAVFQDYKNNLNEFQIHHLEWEIENIDIKSLKIDYPRFSKFLSH